MAKARRPPRQESAREGCSSSVVEHSLGKGEVESSILSCSTIYFNNLWRGDRSPNRVRYHIATSIRRGRLIGRSDLFDHSAEVISVRRPSRPRIAPGRLGEDRRGDRRAVAQALWRVRLAGEAMTGRAFSRRRTATKPCCRRQARSRGRRALTRAMPAAVTIRAERRTVASADAAAPCSRKPQGRPQRHRAAPCMLRKSRMPAHPGQGFAPLSVAF